jgi:hypothetical protein
VPKVNGAAAILVVKLHEITVKINAEISIAAIGLILV